jgi:two-component system, chemotaxis family, chemotaxis protein CheY
MAKKVLSVGQCAIDHGNVSRALQSEFGADVRPAATADEALAALRGGSFALVLVNRVFDANGDSGLDFIRHVKAEAPGVPVMLVSNFADAQAQAIEAGALPGFGKAALNAPETLARLKERLL